MGNVSYTDHGCGVDWTNDYRTQITLRFTLGMIAELSTIRDRSEALGEPGHIYDGIRMISWLNCEFIELSCVDHVVIL